MPLAEVVANGIAALAHACSERISTCAAHGISCEGWLKVGLIHRLSDPAAPFGSVDIIAEKNHVDLTFETASERVLLELKTFPTNYGRGGGKPVTNFIKSVIDDLNKLTAERGPSDCGLVAWLAYVVPDPEPAQWANHLDRVEAAARRTQLAIRIPLWKQAFANLYIMESR